MRLACHALALVACLAVTLPLSPAARMQPAATILFADDFSGRELDRSKWTPEVWGHTVNDEQHIPRRSVQLIGYLPPGHSPTDPVHQRDVARRWVEWLRAHLK